MLIIKEIFGPTIQGEGETAGCPAIFIRFSGCNMWSGDPKTKAKSMCPYCDTDFWKGKKMLVSKVIDKVISKSVHTNMLVVLTGGEPLLQNTEDLVMLINLLDLEGFTIQVETNGTINKPTVFQILDYVTCSPKVPPKECKIDWEYVDSVKLLYPHPDTGITAESMDAHLKKVSKDVMFRFLQPIDTQDQELNNFNINATVQKVKELGLPWTLSLQTHKIIGQP